MKKITSFLTLLFCIFWYSTCLAVQAGDNSPVSSSVLKEVVLPAKASSGTPAWTDGYRVPLSVDTTGSLRVTGSISGRTLTSSSAYIGATSVTAKIITGNAGQIKIYGLVVVAEGASPNFTFKYGTGVNCGTGTVQITIPFLLNTGSGLAMGPSSIPLFTVPANNDLCVFPTTGSVSAMATYIQE